jgi:SAM-dependent methyltransferase
MASAHRAGRSINMNYSKDLYRQLSSILDQTKPNDYVEWNRRRILSCVSYLSSKLPLKGMRTLDLGHDTHVGTLLAFLGCQLRGNVAPEDIPEHEAARGSWSFSAESGENLTWSLDAFNFEEHFPYKDNSFDLVTAMEVIEHVSTSPKKFLGEVARVLRPGGYLYVATPNAACWAKILRQFSHAPVSDSRAYSISWDRRHPMCHVYEYTPWELKEFLTSNGFEVLSLATWDPYPSDPRGIRNIVLRLLVALSLGITGNVRQSALMFRHRGHQLGLLARIHGSAEN